MPIPRPMRERAVPVALAALAFLLALAQRPGLAVTDTKVDLHVDPAGFLGDVLSAWSDTGDLGHVQGGQYGGYAFPMAPFFALFHAVGMAPWLVQRLWLGLGAVSLDLMLAMIVTSLLRGRMNRTVWRESSGGRLYQDDEFRRADGTWTGDKASGQSWTQDRKDELLDLIAELRKNQSPGDRDTYGAPTALLLAPEPSTKG